MAKDFGPIAKAIVDNLGGVANIGNLTHCMTRLRFVLLDNSLVKMDTLKAANGVLGVAEASGQVQVIIGNNVNLAYSEILKLGDFGEASDLAKGKIKQKVTVKYIFSVILDGLVGSMSPIIPPIIGGAILKLIASFMPDHSTTTYTLINAIGDAPFYFLPVLIAVSASKKFKCNTFLAASLGALFVLPQLMGLMDTIAAAPGGRGGFVFMFGFIPIAWVKYTYTIFPALLATLALSVIEKWVDSWCPVVLKNFLKPILVMLLAAIVGLAIAGPIGYFIGYGISWVVLTLFNVMGPMSWLMVAIMGALWPLLVMTGMHRVFTPMILGVQATGQSEYAVMPAELGANVAQGGAALAVAIKTKNAELKQTAFAAAATALFGGITEPALFGVNMRLKRPLIATMITGFVCGAIAGLTHLGSTIMVSPGILSSPQFYDPANMQWTVMWTVIDLIVAIGLSFTLTLVLGFKDIPVGVDETSEGDAGAVTAASVSTGDAKSFVIRSPLKGKLIAMKDVKDETFATEVLGKGIAVIPSDGKIYSPFDAEIMQFETGHALGLTAKNGVEILVHVGINTVELKGEGFKAHYKSGDKVKKGDLLLEFDIELIKSKGYDITTPVIITEKNKYQNVQIIAAYDTAANVGTDLLRLE
ncbi:PTS beta-glucoside transporter subunit EIIBCA [Spirochaetia bacterium]|nr:PTS beta-glucoside transporter subunit EIIBCA [Spirochaetia bacterium]